MKLLIDERAHTLCELPRAAYALVWALQATVVLSLLEGLVLNTLKHTLLYLYCYLLYLYCSSLYSLFTCHPNVRQSEIEPSPNICCLALPRIPPEGLIGLLALECGMREHNSHGALIKAVKPPCY